MMPAMEELAVVLAIADYCRPNLRVPPSRQFLAFLAGLEQDRFDSALQSLIDKGYAAVESEFDDAISIKLSGLFSVIQEFSMRGVPTHPTQTESPSSSMDRAPLTAATATEEVVGSNPASGNTNAAHDFGA